MARKETKMLNINYSQGNLRQSANNNYRPKFGMAVHISSESEMIKVLGEDIGKQVFQQAKSIEKDLDPLTKPTGSGPLDIFVLPFRFIFKREEFKGLSVYVQKETPSPSATTNPFKKLYRHFLINIRLSKSDNLPVNIEWDIKGDLYNSARLAQKKYL